MSKSNNRIYIPNVNKDERIGSSFNYLFRVILNTQRIKCDRVIWDFKECRFLHPFFLAPLAIYKQQCNKIVNCENIPNYLVEYLELVCFHSPRLINSEEEVKILQQCYLSKTYIPICTVQVCNQNLDKIQSVFQKIIEKQSNADSKMRTPLSYFLGELFCNIEQHSQSKKAHIFAQTLSLDGYINLCIADEGITIYGSYLRTNKYLEQIGDSEGEALRLAKEGHSTKDLPKSQNRGYGISSTRKMLVEGLGGAFFMFSGRAFYRHDRKKEAVVELPEEYNWNGTIILMKIPTKVDENFNYNKYIY